MFDYEIEALKVAITELADFMEMAVFDELGSVDEGIVRQKLARIRKAVSALDCTTCGVKNGEGG